MSTPDSSSRARHHRVAQLTLVGEVAVHRALVDPARSATARTVSARQFQTGNPWSSSAPAARIRSRVSAARWRRTGLSYRRRGAFARSASRRDDRQRLPPADRRRRRELGAVPVDVPFREPLQHLLERDAAFEPGQRRAEAEVRAEAEREVLADRRGGCRTGRRRDSGGRRGSPAPTRNSMALPSGTVCPWCSTSRAT